jgi:hypothetical protein
MAYHLLRDFLNPGPSKLPNAKVLWLFGSDDVIEALFGSRKAGQARQPDECGG